MSKRTRSWFDTIITRLESEDTTRLVIAEPGDVTRYVITIAPIVGPMSVLCTWNGYNVTVWNLSNRPRSIFVNMGALVTWRDIRDELHIAAEGSCYFITELLTYEIGTRCQTYDEFYADYVSSLKKSR